jgi:hypothetical protein
MSHKTRLDTAAHTRPVQIALACLLGRWHAPCRAVCPSSIPRNRRVSRKNVRAILVRRCCAWPVNKNPKSLQWLQACLAATALLLVSCDESVRSRYDTAAAARAADGDRGWLPAELPNSAFAISESHDLDTNTGGGSFSFGASDADSFRAKLQPASPADLERFRHPKKLQREGYSFYVVPEFVLAVSWQKRHVHFVLFQQK